MTDTGPRGRLHLLVMAKDPVPGRVKTRLEPRFGAQGAADLAMACLLDTLDAAAAAPVARRTLIFDSRRPGWLPARFGHLRQRGDGLDARLAHAFDDAYLVQRSAMVLMAVTPPKSTPAISPPPWSVSTTGPTP